MGRILFSVKHLEQTYMLKALCIDVATTIVFPRVTPDIHNPIGKVPISQYYYISDKRR